LRRASAIISILLYLNALIIPVFPVFNYVINTDIYVALCINKDKPKLECNGKCHLSEELEQAENSNEDKPLLEINMKDFPIGFVNFVELDNISFDFSTSEIEFEENYSFALEYDIYTPPKS